MPKRPKEHGNDALATDKLRAVLPKIWTYKSVRDVFSGFEYGEDWLIEVVENDNPTGIEFCVQNKVTSKIGKRSISANIEVETLHRLHKLMRPVLIHIYSTTADKSYWMWLEDYYAKNNTKWTRKKEVSVPIPTRNVLDTSSVRHIQEYARNFHQRQSFIKRYEAISRVDPDYEFETRVKGNENWVVVHAKHENPRPLMLSFNDQAAEAFQKFYETGESTQILGSIYLEGAIEPTEGDLTFWPIVPDKSFPLKIQMFSRNDELLCEIPYLNMKLTKPGSVYETWQGKSKVSPITFTIISNHQNRSGNVSLGIDPSIKNPIELRKWITLSDCFSDAEKYLLTNVETGISIEVSQDQITSKNLVPIDEFLRRLILALAEIAEKLGITIDLPEHYSYEELENAEAVARILDTGIDSLSNDSNTNSMVIKIPAIAVQQLVNTTDEDTRGIIMSGTKHDTFELFGHQLDLGPVESVFYGDNVDFDELRERLKKVCDFSNEIIEVYFELDKEHSSSKFLNWYKGNKDSSDKP